MANVHDIATYMLRRRSMTAMKLQKLVYYAQGWHLATRGARLFDDDIEAWANGPVIRELYDVHRGRFSLGSWPMGDSKALTADEKATVDLVLETYGEKDAQWLSEQTHREAPWNQARFGVPAGTRSTARIDTGLMRTFYAAELREGRDPAQVIGRS